MKNKKKKKNNSTDDDPQITTFRDTFGRQEQNVKLMYTRNELYDN